MSSVLKKSTLGRKLGKEVGKVFKDEKKEEPPRLNKGVTQDSIMRSSPSSESVELTRMFQARATTTTSPRANTAAPPMQPRATMAPSSMKPVRLQAQTLRHGEVRHGEAHRVHHAPSDPHLQHRPRSSSDTRDQAEAAPHIDRVMEEKRMQPLPLPPGKNRQTELSHSDSHGSNLSAVLSRNLCPGHPSPLKGMQQKLRESTTPTSTSPRTGLSAPVSPHLKTQDAKISSLPHHIGSVHTQQQQQQQQQQPHQQPHQQPQASGGGAVAAAVRAHQQHNRSWAATAGPVAGGATRTPSTGPSTATRVSPSPSLSGGTMAAKRGHNGSPALSATPEVDYSFGPPESGVQYSLGPPQEDASPICPQCNTPSLPTNRFCNNCGCALENALSNNASVGNEDDDSTESEQEPNDTPAPSAAAAPSGLATTGAGAKKGRSISTNTAVRTGGRPRRTPPGSQLMNQTEGGSGWLGTSGGSGSRDKYQYINLSYSQQKCPHCQASFVIFRTIDYSELRLEPKAIGKGTFAEVHRALWRGSKVAVKKLLFDNMDDDTMTEFQREVSVISVVAHHPNIIHFVGACTEPPNFCLVFQYCQKGSMYDLLIKRKAELPWKLVIKMIIGASAGIMHLHLEGVIHRDIAARNMLVTESYECLVSDFGLARTVNKMHSVGNTASLVGPVRYMAPEAIKDRQYSTASDAYSFGVFLWEVVTREKQPFPHIKDPLQVAFGVAHSNWTPDIPAATPDHMRQLMRECWHETPSMRPQFGEINGRLLAYYDTISDTMQMPAIARGKS